MTLRDLSSNGTPKIRRRDWFKDEHLYIKLHNGMKFYFDLDTDQPYPFSLKELFDDMWEEYKGD